MKFILTAALAFFTILLSAQSGTTLDEYRYLSKGYAYQLEMGLDPSKKGYDIRQNYTSKNGAVVMGLYRTDDQTLGALLITSDDQSGKAHYSVLPNPDSEKNVWQLHKSEVAQQRNNQAFLKIAQAKDEYLFMLATIATKNTGNQSILANTSSSTSSNQPITYEDFPTTQNDRLTSKGGSSVIRNDYPDNSAIPALENPSVNTVKPIGTTVTGQLNTELSSRSVLIVPFTQNTTKAKGRVMIKFCVNGDGSVTFAKFTQRGSTTLNSTLKALALEAVRKMRLSTSATTEDCGTVGFDF